jgi:hypothetical protein
MWCEGGPRTNCCERLNCYTPFSRQSTSGNGMIAWIERPIDDKAARSQYSKCALGAHPQPKIARVEYRLHGQLQLPSLPHSSSAMGGSERVRYVQPTIVHGHAKGVVVLLLLNERMKRRRRLLLSSSLACNGFESLRCTTHPRLAAWPIRVAIVGA